MKFADSPMDPLQSTNRRRPSFGVDGQQSLLRRELETKEPLRGGSKRDPMVQQRWPSAPA